MNRRTAESYKDLSSKQSVMVLLGRETNDNWKLYE